MVLTRPNYRRFAVCAGLACRLSCVTAGRNRRTRLRSCCEAARPLSDADDYPRAAASFERARQIAPDNLPANRGLVLSLLQLGRLTEATQIGREAVARWPRDAQLQHWLGLAYFKAGQNAPALEALRRSEALESGHFDIHFDLALGLAPAEPICPRGR